MYRRPFLAGFAAAGAGYLSVPAPARPLPVDPPFAVTEFSVEAEKTAPTHPYVLRKSAVYDHEAAHEETTAERITALDALDPAVAGVVRRAIDDPVRMDSLPDGLRETLSRYDFFVPDPADDGGRTHYGVTLHKLDPDAPPAIEFEATLVDADVTADDPGAIEFAVRNVSETTRYLATGPTPPFDLLRADATAGVRQFLLWTDYEYSAITAEHVSYNHWLVLQSVAVPPGERRARRYELRANTADEEPGPGLGPGSFRVDGTLSFSEALFAPTATRTAVEWGVEFTVERG